MTPLSACNRCEKWAANTPLRLAQRGENARGIADFEFAGCLDVQRLDHAVVDHHCVALGTDSHAARRQILLQTERPRESRTAVRHHAHLARGVLIASPRAHHERVVDGHAPDLVDAGRAQRGGLLDVTGHVLRRTGRRERAGQSEDHHTLTRGLFAHVETVRSDRATGALVHSPADTHFTCRSESLPARVSLPACAGTPGYRTCRPPFPAAPARAKPPYRATYARQPAYPARRSPPRSRDAAACMRAACCRPADCPYRCAAASSAPTAASSPHGPDPLPRPSRAARRPSHRRTPHRKSRWHLPQHNS